MELGSVLGTGQGTAAARQQHRHGGGPLRIGDCSSCPFYSPLVAETMKLAGVFGTK